jgi:hypothetical protein
MPEAGNYRDARALPCVIGQCERFQVKKQSKCESYGAVGSEIQSQCFASVSQCAGAQSWIDTARLRIVAGGTVDTAQSCQFPCQQKGALRQ